MCFPVSIAQDNPKPEFSQKAAMRIPFNRVLFALAVVFALPAMAHAQFQEPTQEELKMTADPKAPGAAAVYLYREETTDDNLHFHSYYERIKVLTEKGKELATIRVPYERGQFKVTDIKGRTIHSDGAVVPLTAKPSDLVDLKTKSLQVDTMVFTLPDVQVGSILEYRLQLRYDDNVVSSPVWHVQQPYFVHKAHYRFTPSSNVGIFITNSRGDVLNRLMWGLRANPDSKVDRDATGHYTFDITDVPPIPAEDWMPPLNSLNWRVEFYYTAYGSDAEFWQKEGKRWAKDTDRFASPSKSLGQAVTQIVAAVDSEDQKAHKLYEAVMKLDNTSFTREKSSAERKAEKLKEVKDADTVWQQKSGSADELALLYVALARAAGLKSYPIQVVNRDRAIFDPNYLSLNQLDDYVAVVVIGGKEVFVDPGQAMCPFGLLHWKHTFADGMRISEKGQEFARTPAMTYLQDTVQRLADLTIAEDGATKGTIRIVMTGEDALRWRQLTLENDTSEVKKQFNEWMRDWVPDGVQVDFDHFLALEDYNSNLIGVVNVSGNIGSATGKHFFLPGQFFESRARHPFVAQDKRITPIDVHYARMEQDEVTYHLPPGFKVESAPQATSTSWPEHAMLTIKSVASGDRVDVKRLLAYNYTLLAPKDYPDLHDFYLKVATADQQQLVLTRATVAQGN